MKKVQIATEGGTFDVQPERSAVSDDQIVVYGIRPEHLDLSQTGLESTISVVEPTGSETMVVLRSGDRDISALFRDRHDFKPGDSIFLKPRPKAGHIFDPESGQRISHA